MLQYNIVVCFKLFKIKIHEVIFLYQGILMVCGTILQPLIRTRMGIIQLVRTPGVARIHRATATSLLLVEKTSQTSFYERRLMCSLTDTSPTR